MKKLLTIILCLLIQDYIISQTIIPGGNVSGTWTASGSPYLINGDITVLNNTTLVIQQGVEVVFQNFYSFSIEGILVANGTPADSILFTVADTSGFFNGSHSGWGGISANNQLSNVSFNFCIIEYSKASGLLVDNISSFSIQNSHLRYNLKGLCVYEMNAEMHNLKSTYNDKGIYLYMCYNCSLDSFNLSSNKINGLEIRSLNSVLHFNGYHGIIKDNGSSGISVFSAEEAAFFYLTDVLIEGNGNDTILGGGIYTTNFLSLENVIVRNNKAYDGGGIYSTGIVYSFEVSDLILNNTTIENNFANNKGGGIYYNGYHVLFSNSIIRNNQAFDGGGAYIKASIGYASTGNTDLTLFKMEISKNQALNNGGGIYFNFNTVGFSYGNRNIAKCTMADNTASNSGSEIYNNSSLPPLLLPIKIENSIIYSASSLAIIDTYSNFQFNFSDLSGSWPGISNINVDPFFVDPSEGNYKLGWINFPADDYTKSPCIDTGDPLTTNDPDGTIADIGAYYFDHFAQTQVTLDITAYLEGPFLNNQMTTTLNTLNYLPLNQPYIGSPWKHYGTESVTSIPNADIVDWVLVEIRKLYNSINPDNFTTESRQVAFLLKNGQIKGLDGTSMINFHTSENDSLYICIFHRNHLPLVSANPIVTGVNPISYNFSTGAEMAMGGEHVQNQLSSSIWGMIASDGTKDSQVENKDKNDAWLTKTGNNGYYLEDYNMNGGVDFADILLWEGNTGKGNSVSHTILPYRCGLPFQDERDEKVYSTVQIGNQCWMAENLNIGTMIPGSTEMANNSVIEKYCFDNSSNNCNIYGGLYQWNEMMQYNTFVGAQGICPENWHIPSDGEWTTLTDFIGVEEFAGGNMKTTGTIEAGTGLWYDPNYGATNSSGFSALPAGSRNSDGNFYHMGYNAFLWSSSESTTTKAWYRILYSTYAIIFPNNYDKNSVFSVRCLHGEYINQPPTTPFNPLPQDGAIDQQLNTNISWSCSDPENDPKTYDIYFGSTNPPTLVSLGETATTYNPGSLEYNNTYYWKVVVHDDHANSTTGPVWLFTTIAEPVWNCGDPLLDTRDGQTYPTVLIGTQCWMAENLNIGTRINGVNNPVNNGIIEKYCYGDNESDCNIYGGLYKWNEMMNYSTSQGIQGICTDGWHLPTDAELLTITNYLGGDEIAGGKLKQTGTFEGGNGLWLDPNDGATNETQFTGLPAAYRSTSGDFNLIHQFGYFWSSSQNSANTSNAFLRMLFYNYPDFMSIDYSKNYGFSVRCLKN